MGNYEDIFGHSKLILNNSSGPLLLLGNYFINLNFLLLSHISSLPSKDAIDFYLIENRVQVCPFFFIVTMKNNLYFILFCKLNGNGIFCFCKNLAATLFLSLHFDHYLQCLFLPVFKFVQTSIFGEEKSQL